jgi:hypothetical protein
MITELSGFPTGIRIMAFLAIGSKFNTLMIRIGCVVIILLMAGDTLPGKAGIVSVGMTTVAFNAMSAGQWKNGMIEISSCPAEPAYQVTVGTVPAVSALLMVRIGSASIILLMTIITFDRQGVKAQQGA